MKSIFSLFIFCFLMISLIETSEANNIETNAKVSRIIDAGTIQDDRNRIIRIQSVRGSNDELAIKQMSAFLPKDTPLQVSYRTTDMNGNIVAAVNILKQGELINYQWLAFDQAIAWYDGSEIMSYIEEYTSLHLFMSPTAPFKIGASIKGLTEQEYNEITVLRNSVYRARDEVLNTPSDKEFQLTLDQLAVQLYSQHSEQLYAWHFMNHPSSKQISETEWEMQADVYMDNEMIKLYNARAASGLGYATKLTPEQSGVKKSAAWVTPEHARVDKEHWLILLLIGCVFAALYFKLSKPKHHEEDKANKKHTPSKATNLVSIDMLQAITYYNEMLKTHNDFSHLYSSDLTPITTSEIFEEFNQECTDPSRDDLSGFGALAAFSEHMLALAEENPNVDSDGQLATFFAYLPFLIGNEFAENDLTTQDWAFISRAMENGLVKRTGLDQVFPASTL